MKLCQAFVQYQKQRSHRNDNSGINFIEVENNEISNLSEVGTMGTTVTSRNIFYNVPARRKFLKSDKIEFKHIINEFVRLSLSHHEINLH